MRGRAPVAAHIMPAGHANAVMAGRSISEAKRSNENISLSPPISPSGRQRKSTVRNHAPEYTWTDSTTPDAFLLHARDTIVVRKINEANHTGITLEELMELLSILNQDIINRTEVTQDDIRVFLMQTFEPACTLEEVEAVWDVTMKNIDGFISLDELLNSITQGAICKLLNDLFKDVAAKQKEVVHQVDYPVNRELLVERVNWRANRDDAFLTLPYAVTYMMVFIALVVTHLRIWERRKVETGLMDWLVGYSKDWGGPYIKEHVNNVPSFWTWLDDTGLPSVFAHEMTRAGQPSIMMANRNYVISDVMITQKRKDEDDRIDWFIHSPEGQAVVKPAVNTTSKGTFLDAALARSKYLQSTVWADQATEELKLTWCTYNEEVHMFARTQIKIIYDPYGVVSPKVVTTAILMQPYKHWEAVIFSGLFVACIVYPLVMEGRELMSSLRHGWRGFKEYWGFWNFMDWLAITVGIVSSVIWILCGSAINADALQNLVLDDLSLVPNFMSWNDTQMVEVFDALDVVIRQFFVLHLFLAFDVLAIVMKLFKAFQSNSRLSVVTDTLVAACVDIIHFMIVFMVIFASFALVGHILFGQDLREFTSFGDSMMTSFHILMGEFGWYAEFYIDPTGFGSGLPAAFLTIWFLSFMTFVLLVLLNMLLAVILERYTQQASALEGSAEAPTLWEQVGRFRKRRKETKGFISMNEIGMYLDSSPDVHPGEIVTANSLREAFEKMKPEQAAYLMKWLAKEAATRSHKEDLEDVGAKLAGIESFVSNIAEEMHLVKLNVTACVKKLNLLEETMPFSPNASLSGSPRRPKPTAAAPIGEKATPESEALFSRFSEQLVQQQTTIQELVRALQDLNNVTTTLTSRAEAQEQFNQYQVEEKLKDPQLSRSMQASNFARSSGPKVLPPCLFPGTSNFEYSPRTRFGNQRDGWPNRQSPTGQPSNVDDWRR